MSWAPPSWYFVSQISPWTLPPERITASQAPFYYQGLLPIAVFNFASRAKTERCRAPLIIARTEEAPGASFLGQHYFWMEDHRIECLIHALKKHTCIHTFTSFCALKVRTLAMLDFCKLEPFFRACNHSFKCGKASNLTYFLNRDSPRRVDTQGCFLFVLEVATFRAGK